jgi:hypothetical protein
MIKYKDTFDAHQCEDSCTVPEYIHSVAMVPDDSPQKAVETKTFIIHEGSSSYSILLGFAG